MVYSILSASTMFALLTVTSLFAFDLWRSGDGVLGSFALFLLSGPVFLILTFLFSWLGMRRKEPHLAAFNLIAGGCAFCLVAFHNLYDWQKDLSPVVFQAKYFNEEGFELYLRKDGTFKFHETTILGGSTTYGKYQVDKDTFLLSKSPELEVGKRQLSPKFYRVGDKLRYHHLSAAAYYDWSQDTVMWIVHDNFD